MGIPWKKQVRLHRICLLFSKIKKSSPCPARDFQKIFPEHEHFLIKPVDANMRFYYNDLDRGNNALLLFSQSRQPWFCVPCWAFKGTAKKEYWHGCAMGPLTRRSFLKPHDWSFPTENSVIGLGFFLCRSCGSFVFFPLSGFSAQWRKTEVWRWKETRKIAALNRRKCTPLIKHQRRLFLCLPTKTDLLMEDGTTYHVNTFYGGSTEIGHLLEALTLEKIEQLRVKLLLAK